MFAESGCAVAVDRQPGLEGVWRAPPLDGDGGLDMRVMLVAQDLEVVKPVVEN